MNDLPSAERDGSTFTFSRDELSFFLTFVEEAVVATDHAGQITFASPGVRELTGFESEHLIGQSVFDYLHPDDIAKAADALDRWTGRPGAVKGPHLRARHASEGWVLVSVEALTGPRVGPLGSLVMTMRAVHDATTVEQKLRQALVSEDRLTRLARTFLHMPAGSFDDGVDLALAEMGSLEGVDRVSVWRITDDGEFQHKTHEWLAPDIPSTMGGAPWLPITGFAFQDALTSLREVNVPRVDQLPETWDMERQFWTARGVQSCLAVPMIERGHYVGFLSFDALREPREFDSLHVMTLRTAAGILAEAFAHQDAETRLAFQARHDGLTGLGNRWSFLDDVAEALARIDGGAVVTKGVAVLLLDIDRFKVVNDSLGHTAGDHLLRAVAMRLAEALDPDHTMARLGGDELVVLARDVTSIDTAVSIARQQLKVLDDPFTVGGHEVYVSASMGVAYASAASVDVPEELLRQADAAMYSAKEHGRGGVEVFDDKLRARVNRRLRDENDLRRALGQGELTVHYQPEIDVDTDKVLAVEALVRWHHPDRGLLNACEFVHIAEETGVILDIGPWVLRQACEQFARWKQQNPDLVLTMRVNLSARQLTQPDLLPGVVQVIEDTGIDPTHLCLEITETALMADAEVSLEVLVGLRELGVELAVDDFGTGYSSLAYLKRFPVTLLKIDRSFVIGLGHDPEDTAIVQAVISLARALSLEVTAEGVETKEQLDEVRRLGCHRVQGFLLARPEAPDEVMKRLA